MIHYMALTRIWGAWLPVSVNTQPVLDDLVCELRNIYGRDSSFRTLRIHDTPMWLHCQQFRHSRPTETHADIILAKTGIALPGSPVGCVWFVRNLFQIIPVQLETPGSLMDQFG
jgi:hypothetical protein